MIMRNIVLCVLLLCLSSLFVGVPFAEAHRGVIYEAERLRNNALKEKIKWEKKHKQAEGFVKDLLSEWDQNSDSIKDGTWDVANTVIATIIYQRDKNANTTPTHTT